MNPAAIAEPVEDSNGDGRWMSLHNCFIQDAKDKEPEVLFLGDSLFQRLENTEMWDKMFVPLHCLNFCIGGDQTQHLLWRIQNGELENLAPKVIVVLIGTNNCQHTAEQTYEGILEVTRTIHEKQPQAQIIVMSIPPRGQRPNPQRERITEINRLLAERIPDEISCQFVNVDPAVFCNADDTINRDDMFDFLHFTKSGYLKLLEPLLDEIQILLKNFMKADSASCGEPDN